MATEVFCIGSLHFDPLGQWEVDRGEQKLGYDFAWYLGYDVAVTGEWARPIWWRMALFPKNCWQESTVTVSISL
jgi:selenium-binding protein 1